MSVTCELDTLKTSETILLQIGIGDPWAGDETVILGVKGDGHMRLKTLQLTTKVEARCRLRSASTSTLIFATVEANNYKFGAQIRFGTSLPKNDV